MKTSATKQTFGSQQVSMNHNWLVKILPALMSFCFLFMSPLKMSAQHVKTDAAITFQDNNSAVNSLHITSIAAKMVDNCVYLKWTVLKQKKSGTYVVQRSWDGVEYQAIGVKQGVGTTLPVNILYCFMDKTPLKITTVYYRILYYTDDNNSYCSKPIVVNDKNVVSFCYAK